MKSRLRRLIAIVFERQMQRLIRRHGLKVVAVAGSVGKTSTKMAVATVLSQKYRVFVQPGNYNSELGVPLSVFDLHVPASLINVFAWTWRLIQSELRLHSYPYEVVVIELGTERPGEVPHFMTYLKPDVGVVTAVTSEHMENFPGGIEEVAAEELSLTAGSKAVVLNTATIAASYQRRFVPATTKQIGYGAGGNVHWVGETEITLHGAKFAAKSSVIGDHSRQALLAAAAVAEALGLSHEQIAAGIEAVRPVPGRMNPLAGVGGSRIIDDTYNSSPEAVLAALATLAEMPATRRFAVLGSMNELGADSPRYHADMGQAAAGLDYLVTIGADANKYLGPAAVKAGLDPTRCLAAASPYAAGRHLATMLGPGDLVLIKGSQNGVFAEETTRLLLADPVDSAHLVRQGSTWQKIKREQFSDYA